MTTTIKNRIISTVTDMAFDAITEIQDNSCAEREEYDRAHGHRETWLDWMHKGYDAWDDVELSDLLARIGMRKVSGKVVAEAKHAFIQEFIRFACWSDCGFEY